MLQNTGYRYILQNTGYQNTTEYRIQVYYKIQDTRILQNHDTGILQNTRYRYTTEYRIQVYYRIQDSCILQDYMYTTEYSIQVYSRTQNTGLLFQTGENIREANLTPDNDIFSHLAENYVTTHPTMGNLTKCFRYFTFYL